MNRVTADVREPNVFALEAEIAHPVEGVEIAVSGPLSVRTSGQVRTQLARAIDGGEGDLILNLDGAEVYDATGLGVLIGAHHRASRGGRRLVMTGASPRLCRLMKVTKLDRVIARSELAESAGSLSLPTALAS